MKQYLIQTFSQLKDSSIAVLATFSLFLAPIAQVLIFVITLSILDLLTGLSAARKENITITSKKIWKYYYQIVFIYGCSYMCSLFRHTSS